MPASKSKMSFEAEILNRFNTSNELFSLGANIGIKSFEHLITISSAALGLLFSYKQGIFKGEIPVMTTLDLVLWFSATAAFSITILASIRRNYHAGNGLVFLSDYIRSRAHKKIDPSNSDFLKNERIAYRAKKVSDQYRKMWSLIARFCFYWAVTSMAGFILLGDLLNFIYWLTGLIAVSLKVLIEKNQVISNIITIATLAALNSYIGFIFGKDAEAENTDDTKVDGGRRQT